jgi:hypothetical protein
LQIALPRMLPRDMPNKSDFSPPLYLSKFIKKRAKLKVLNILNR